MVGFGERMRSYIRGRGLTQVHRLDHYLTEHLPRLIREHELATQARLRPIDEQFARHRSTVGDLERWKGDSTERLNRIRKRVGRLEVKYGLGGR